MPSRLEAGGRSSFALIWTFYLQRSRDASAAKQFFRKALKAPHTQEPRVINVDKNAAEPKAINELKADKELPQSVELRHNKYLNNLALAGA